MCACGETANVLDSGFEVSEFELNSIYNVHFRTKTLQIDRNRLDPTKLLVW